MLPFSADLNSKRAVGVCGPVFPRALEMTRAPVQRPGPRAGVAHVIRNTALAGEVASCSGRENDQLML